MGGPEPSLHRESTDSLIPGTIECAECVGGDHLSNEAIEQLRKGSYKLIEHDIALTDSVGKVCCLPILIQAHVTSPITVKTCTLYTHPRTMGDVRHCYWEVALASCSVEVIIMMILSLGVCSWDDHRKVKNIYFYCVQRALHLVPESCLSSEWYIKHEWYKKHELKYTNNASYTKNASKYAMLI